MGDGVGMVEESGIGRARERGSGEGIKLAVWVGTSLGCARELGCWRLQGIYGTKYFKSTYSIKNQRET